MLIRERCQISCRQAVGHALIDFSDQVDGIDPQDTAPRQAERSGFEEKPDSPRSGCEFQN